MAEEASSTTNEKRWLMYGELVKQYPEEFVRDLIAAAKSNPELKKPRPQFPDNPAHTMYCVCQLKEAHSETRKKAFRGRDFRRVFGPKHDSTFRLSDSALRSLGKRGHCVGFRVAACLLACVRGRAPQGQSARVLTI